MELPSPNQTSAMDVGRSTEEDSPVQDDKLIKKNLIGALKRILQNNSDPDESSKEIDENIQPHYCVEDSISSRDLKVTVNEIGSLNFPLENSCIKKLIEKSSKARFGRGEDTVLDTNVRNTQMIPASQLDVTINRETLTTLLEHLGRGLNTPKGSSLELHLHNLLIYGPGQFFKKHKDTEKLENMVATLVIVLPSPHKGGDLIIEHNHNQHLFCGSSIPAILKCVAFYADCDHEIKEVTEGYRVALTYNIVLKSSNNPDFIVDDDLDQAVNKYFANGGTRLVYQMAHSYSEHSLKWNFLKSEDRISANALFAIANKQGRVPWLALASHHEVYDVEERLYNDEEDLRYLYEDTELYYWVDQNGVHFNNPGYIDGSVDDEETFFMKKTSDIFEPYEVEESGWTGNEGEKQYRWYRRACVVLFVNKWVFSHGFKCGLLELHQLTKVNGRRKSLKNKLDVAGSNFIQPIFWNYPDNSKLLVDIVIYLNSSYYASLILGKLKSYLLDENQIGLIINIKNQFGPATWKKIVDSWKEAKYFSGENVTKGLSFIIKYIDFVKEVEKSQLLTDILTFAVNEYTTQYKQRTHYIHDRTQEDTVSTLCRLFKLCADLNMVNLLSILFKDIVDNPKVFPAVRLQKILKPDQWQSSDCRELLQSTVNDIEACLTRLGDTTDWSMPVSNYCKCDRFCSAVIDFFNSSVSVEQVISAKTKMQYNHLRANFTTYSDSPYTISFTEPKEIHLKKLPIHEIEQTKLKQALLSYQKVLLSMNN